MAQSAKADEAERFVNALLTKMTLEEKIGQMEQISWKDTPVGERDGLVRSGSVGSILFVTDPKEIARLQHIAVDESRLHIPLIYGFDVVHGFRTIYPIPLAMASSWDPATVEQAQSMAARDASSVGIHWAFAPMVDIARDARWGRMMEGAGEDPYLGAQMAAAQVRGFQGAKLDDGHHIMACVKHFAGYGGVEGGRDYDQSNLSDEQLWNVYLPPFHAAEQAGAGSFMTAYMDLNGVPATGNAWLLKDVLRGEWGFKGFVVSDWESVKSLTVHGFSADARDAATRAVNAGTEMEMTSHTYRDSLGAAVKDGSVKVATIDTAVHDILMAKYKLGLFAHPYADAPADAGKEHAAQMAAAKKTAERTTVLLRNEGGVLPLKSGVKSIAVVGPMADSKTNMMGSWALGGTIADAVTVLDGVKKRAGAGVTVRYAKGVEIKRTTASIFDDQYPEPPLEWTTAEAKEKGFAEAVKAIKASDVAVLVMGEAQTMNGEAASRWSLTLPGEQERLMEAAVATGKPVVLVLLGGRPLEINWAAQHVPAILEAWYPGTEGGDAIASLLFGDANPGGKLPVSWPRSVGQEPFYYSRNLTQNPQDDGKRYWDGDNTALYPFGFGLSYTTFQVGNLRVESGSIPTNGTLRASVDVENTGSMAGDEVVQLYTHQRAGSASRPRRELKAFTRVSLKPGEKKTVSLEVPAEALAFWSPQTKRSAVEAGAFDVWVGTSSTATEHTTFVVKR